MAWVSASDRVAAALACAALDRDLRGVLLVDLDPALLVPLGRWLAALWRPGAPPEPVPVIAGTDERLWTTVRASRDPHRPGLRLEPGLMVETPDRPPGVFVVPDLTRVTQPVRHALATTLGSDVAHLERDGMSVWWHPEARWLAGCGRADLERVPGHLLDRFPLRVDAAGLGLTGRRVLSAPAAARRAAVHRGARSTATDALLREVAALPAADRIGARTLLAVARTATALSTLDGRALAGPEYLTRACDLTGVAGPGATDDAVVADAVPVTEATPHDGSPAPGAVSGPGPVRVTATADRLEAVPDQIGIVAADGQPPPAQQPAEPARAAQPARRVTPRVAGARRARTVSALGTADIAVVATLLEAATHQRERCPAHFDAAPPGGPHALHVRQEDLRQYRRDRPPRLSLVLLVDHTCLRGWDWGAALAPYLREVYTARGPVDVIEVGSAAAPAAARATMLRVHSALDPRLDAVLSRDAGGATPLAHGLDLAAAALRRAARRDRQAAGHGLLVVVSDGLGNVPREDSRRGRLPVRAGAEGVADALATARRIRSLPRVTSVLIRPPFAPHDGVLRRLAASLGAAVVRPEPTG